MSDSIDKLSYFGYSFQIKVIASLFTDKQFVQRVSDILDPTYFESEPMQWIVKQILKYYFEYKDAPTMEVMKVKLAEIDDVSLKTLVKETLKDGYKHLQSTDLKFIKDETLDFCKNQELKKAILKSVDLLKNSNYDSIKNVIDTALKAGADTNLGHDYAEDIDIRYSESARAVKSTPWDIINDITEGGFGKGELIILAAGPGAGKSMALVNIAVHAAKQGLNVLYYTLELNEAYVSKRIDSLVTGIAQANLKFNLDEVKELVDKLPGKIIVKYYPTKTASVNTLAAHIEKCIATHFKPDLIIVDYADLLKSSNTNKNARKDEMLGELYEELRGMAGTYDVPLFSASQLNRSAAEMDIVGGDKISEAYSKLMVADFVASLSRKMTDKIAGTGRWTIIKNRFGIDGITFPSKLDMSKCKIEIFEESSVKGKETKKDMQKGETLLKKSLANKFKELSDLG
jgi:replicative DNA helicase